VSKFIWNMALLVGLLAGIPIRPAYAVVAPTTSIHQAEHPSHEMVPVHPSSKVVLQVTLDQLILGIGMLSFLAVIYKLSVRPILSMIIIAITALLGCLLIRAIGRF